MLHDAPATPRIVTVDRFVRAESDRYLRNLVTKCGGLGQFSHGRDFTSVDSRVVLRPNRDTLYSVAVFDLEAAPVMLTLPDPGLRFMSMQVINQDHYTPVPVVYHGGMLTLTREQAGTRYAAVAVRILADPHSPADLEAAFALQREIGLAQARVGTLELPSWDASSLTTIRDALFTLGATLDSKRMFGPRNQVDPVRHLIGTAIAWGGNPEQDAYYVNVTPARNDGTTAYTLTVRDVPVDGFWSITVYTADGYFERNTRDAYSVNSVTATKAPDGSITVRLGGRADGAANHLPAPDGWNYMVRLYRPRAEVLNGDWRFPEAQPAT